MKVTITGATGLIGRGIIHALRERGDEVTVLSRDPGAAGGALGVEAVGWDPSAGPAPTAALDGRDAIVHLAGENVAQRWDDGARRRIRASRELGTRHLVAGIERAEPRPRTLVSASAVGIYGPHGDERVTEATPPGNGFLAEVCVAWEREALAARRHGLSVSVVRTGVVLDREGGALARMLPFFRLGVGGPVAGGNQYMPWIHARDVVGIYCRALADDAWDGPINATAPEPVTNRDFSRALGRALHRPAVAPVPGLAVRLLYGEMAEIVTSGQRAVPERAEALGYAFAEPDLDAALRRALE